MQEIQLDLHPLEILYDTCKLLDEEYVRPLSFQSRVLSNFLKEQPLSAAFQKIIQAVGLFDVWLEIQLVPPAEEYEMAQHAVQSIVWREAGQERKLLHVCEFASYIYRMSKTVHC